jgi:hypothetical protein
MAPKRGSTDTWTPREGSESKTGPTGTIPITGMSKKTAARWGEPGSIPKATSCPDAARNAVSAEKKREKMAISRASRKRPTRQHGSIGLTAIGSSGAWEIAIDQTTAGTVRWFAQIEGPAVSLYFEIPSLEVIDRTLEFLTRFRSIIPGKNAAQAAADGTLVLGTSKFPCVELVRDDEFGDRYFLVLEPKRGLVVRFTVTGDDLTHLIDALRQAKEDLE